MDRRFLEWHGNQWRVQVKVPPIARPIVGRSKLVVPLKTDSLANANRLKYAIVGQLKDRIAQAVREAQRRTTRQHDHLLDEALSWRADIEAERDGPEKLDSSGFPDEVVSGLLYERAMEVEKTEGAERASYFYNVGLGTATPLTAFTDAWLAERLDMKPRQKLDYRRAIARFDGWLTHQKLPASIEATPRKIAGQYVSQAMVAKGIHWKTANKDISALSGYWRWLIKKGHAEVNVWAQQSLPKLKVRSEAQRPKRPFTDEEVSILIHGIHQPLLRDAVLVAALSGMRTEEIAQLRIRDCSLEAFSITQAKTAAGVRDVPIHADLRELVSRRIKDKAATEYLFHELSDPTAGSAIERGQGITKRFVTFRRRLGVDERVEGSRLSAVSAHRTD